MTQKLGTIVRPNEVEETGLRLLTKKWLSCDDVCWMLGISKRTLQNYRDQRRLTFYQVGRKIYFRGIDVDDFLEKHHIKSIFEKGGAA